MNVQFTIYRGDLLRFNIYHATHRPLNWAIVGLLSLLVAFTTPSSSFAVKIVLFLLFFAIMSGILFLATAVVALLSYAPAKNRGVFGAHDLSITASEITETTSVNFSKWSWASVPKVSQNRSYIFVYVQQNLAHIVPKRAFPSSEEARVFFEAARSAWRTAQPAA